MVVVEIFVFEILLYDILAFLRRLDDADVLERFLIRRSGCESGRKYLW